MYEYDAEGRQTGTLNALTGLTGYVYDAEGRRVQKVVVEGWNTPHPQTVVEDEYLLGLNNEQISVLNGTGGWQWTNVYAGGRQLATYDSAGTHFALTDWLGTKRVELNVTGVSTIGIGEQCQSLPFGDGLSCTGTDVNQLHFTGKQRDTESGNDYFLARYYASGMAARFLTPDWSKNPQGVPYANYADPQSLDLYSYMRDNPLSGVDADGHLGLGEAPPCQQKGVNGCENYSTNFKKEDAKHLAQQQETATGTNGVTIVHHADGSVETRKGGSVAWRNHNPGNEMSGYGAIGTAHIKIHGRMHNFAIYPNDATGWKALDSNLHSLYWNKSIAAAMEVYAPASDGNDPVAYANALSRAVGVPASTTLSNLSSTQLNTFEHQISVQEGFPIHGTATILIPQQ